MEQEILLASEKISALKKEISKVIVWQEKLVESLIICLLSKWHILIEGLPWLAKTLTISTLWKTLDLDFSRIQFTPDLIPSDLTGTEIFNVKNSQFEIKKWPIFNNFILADEINRAPSKVQSALLEAMAEKTVTISSKTFELEKPFLVLATQNPIENSGTFRLPEAELDRFMMKINVNYPSFEEEKIMYKNIISWQKQEINKIFIKKEILYLQDLSEKIFVSDSIFDYVTRIIFETRNFLNEDLKKYKKYVDFWASPRWWLALLSLAKSFALINWRSFVLPEDIKILASSVLSHRIVLSYEALADEVSASELIEKIIEKIEL